MAVEDSFAGAADRSGRTYDFAGGLRRGKRTLTISSALPLFDFMAISISFFGVFCLYQHFSVSEAELYRYVATGIAFSTVFLICNDYRGLYDHESVQNIPRQIGGLALSWALAWAIFAFTGFALKASADVSRIVILCLVSLDLPVLIIARILLRSQFSSHQSAQDTKSSIALLSFGNASNAAASLAEEHNLILQRFSVESPDEAQLRSEVQAFLRDVKGTNAKALYVSLPFADLGHLHQLEAQLYTSPLPVVLLVEDWVARTFSRPISVAASRIGFELQTPPMTVVQEAIKRSVDALMAGLALLFLMPIMLFVAVAIKVDTKGPVIFRQRRQGFNGRVFHIFKFRSMTVLEDGENINQARKSDSRVTRVGRFIRSTSLDELPQLVNVLRGEMSLVGPRPHAMSHDSYYEKAISGYAMRRHMRPGLTGWAQVNGFRGETPQIKDMESRVNHDLWYIGNWSVALDLWILIRTVGLLLTNRAY
jgi:putative colanic acid biosysnthesis UDP-glucose lipid carrier transferase